MTKTVKEAKLGYIDFKQKKEPKLLFIKLRSNPHHIQWTRSRSND